MTPEEFRTLAAGHESDILDFKRTIYDLKADRAKLTKDIVSMANTPRERSAHIVLGIDWSPESGSHAVGLNQQVDDADVQDAFLQHRVEPRPVFVYHPIRLDGKQFGIIEVKVSKNGPSMTSVDIEGMRGGVVYYRQGSTNKPAIGAQLNSIVSWFGPSSNSTPRQVPADYRHYEWEEFLSATHGLDNGHAFLLAVDRIPTHAASNVAALSQIPWKFVFDFDPNSDRDGLLHQLEDGLASHRLIHRITKGQRQVHPDPGTHWFFARGAADLRETLVSQEGYRHWVMSYKNELSAQVGQAANTIGPSPVSLIVIWSDPDLLRHLQMLIDEINATFQDAVTTILISDNSTEYQSMADDCGMILCRMSLQGLCNGLKTHYSDVDRGADRRRTLPSSSGSPVTISHRDELWFEENLTVLYSDLGLDGEDDDHEYRIGADMSWRNLHLHHDCDRDITTAITARTEKDLQSRSTERINIYHSPGSGGSSVALRVAWNIRDRFPVAILRPSVAEGAASRLSSIATLTESSVLAVVDSSVYTEGFVDDLYNSLRASQTPVVIVHVLRRFQRQRNAARRFWIPSDLTDAEADRFRAAYGRSVPTKIRALTKLAKSTNGQRTAFFFGLTAFGRDFQGLTKYVADRTNGLTVDQRKVLAFIAIAYYYGQQPIQVQAFAHLLGFPSSRTLDVERLFELGSAHALELLTYSKSGDVRATHQLIARELMQQIFAADEGTVGMSGAWTEKLSKWGKDFVNFCAADTRPRRSSLLDVVRRVFIFRDNREVLGADGATQAQYSTFLADIPSRHGRVDMLRHLTESFPEEAHFHAHLGRILGFTGEFEKAIECMDAALVLAPADHVIHHMRGMIYRYRMRSMNVVEQSLDDLVSMAKEAAFSFEESRVHRADAEYAYISEVQMLLDLVDRAGQILGGLNEVFSRPGVDPFLRSSLERAENLLDQVTHLFVGESPSGYVLACMANVQQLYGQFPAALQTLDNLLSRSGVARVPIRRQIVWTLLRSRRGNWDKLSRREISRARKLLEDNLDEEPHDATSLRLWLRIIRHDDAAPTLNSAIERVSYWRSNSSLLDALYYLYVLHMLNGIQGSNRGVSDGEIVLNECRSVARLRRDRTRSFEWVGVGRGVGALVHQSQLGDWSEDFWTRKDRLIRLEGRISSIDAPQKGYVDLQCGLRAFFVPGRSGFFRGRDENMPVTLNLGFSYDGPRAWNVEATTPEA